MENKELVFKINAEEDLLSWRAKGKCTDFMIEPDAFGYYNAWEVSLDDDGNSCYDTFHGCFFTLESAKTVLCKEYEKQINKK